MPDTIREANAVQDAYVNLVASILRRTPDSVRDRLTH